MNLLINQKISESFWCKQDILKVKYEIFIIQCLDDWAQNINRSLFLYGSI